MSRGAHVPIAGDVYVARVLWLVDFKIKEVLPISNILHLPFSL